MSKLTKHKNGSTTAYNRKIRKDNEGRPCIMLIDRIGITLGSCYNVTVSADTKTIKLEKVEK